MIRLDRLQWVAVAAAFAGALALRFDRLQPGLLYPDGYQYLLMARGIGEHLRPTTLLGSGGDLFVPNTDAAAKPLFPALVAALHAFGVSGLGAARIVTAVAAAATVVLTGLVTARLASSRAAGVVAALLVLASPGVVFWAGFAGPGQVGLALALGSALALLRGRYAVGGVLAGLAACARPELLVIAVAAGLAASMRPQTRRAGGRAALAGTAALAVVLGTIRPPLGAPDAVLLAGVPLTLAPAALAPIAGHRRRLVAATAVLAAAAVATAVGTLPGLLELWRGDWALLTLGLVGFVLAAAHGSTRGPAVTTVLLGAVPTAVYALKNPHQERYFALLLPLAAILAGLGVAVAARTRIGAVAAVAGALAVAAAVMLPPPGGSSRDMFASLARDVGRTVSPDVPILTAAPEAYGFRLPTHAVRTLRLGLRGAIVLDAAQRAFAPELTARGRVLARFEPGEAVFVDPRGRVDAGGAVVVLGTVVRR
jgi:hypothetical protein